VLIAASLTVGSPCPNCPQSHEKDKCMFVQCPFCPEYHKAGACIRCGELCACAVSQLIADFFFSVKPGGFSAARKARLQCC